MYVAYFYIKYVLDFTQFVVYLQHIVNTFRTKWLLEITIDLNAIAKAKHNY